ncbi:MAG: hypothetical protein NVS3B20_18110 [Polyangiales bacterium]
MINFPHRPSSFVVAAPASVLLSLLSACGAPQAPYRFTAQSASLDVAVRTLAGDGQEMATVDSTAGVVQTKWGDTGFMFGEIQGVTATLVRRFVVVMAPGGAVTVRMDLKRCQRQGLTLGETDVRGICEVTDTVPGTMQEELNRIGGHIEQAMHASR